MLPQVHIVTIDETSNKFRNLCSFLESELIPFNVFKGLNNHLWGLVSVNNYKYSDPQKNVLLRQDQIGCYLSHYILWRALLFSQQYQNFKDNSQFTILEDDCVFKSDWKENFNLACDHMPKDWDVLMIGSCCTEDKPKTQIGANLYDCKHPFCTHGYIVRGKCLPHLIQCAEGISSPIDIMLAMDAFPNLNVFTILPRICDQDGMDLPQ